MDESTPSARGRDIDVLKRVTGGIGAAGRRMKAAAKPAAKDKTFSWESAFRAERGCLDGGLPLQFTGPIPRH
jgi:hypothetical protein